MKEAAGEANMTVITIVLIAAILGIGTIIVTRMMNSTGDNSCCTQIGGRREGKKCIVHKSNGTDAEYVINSNFTKTYCPDTAQ